MSTSTPDEQDFNTPHGELPPGTIDLGYVEFEPMRCTSIDADGAKEETHLLLTLSGETQILDQIHAMRVPFMIHRENLKTLMEAFGRAQVELEKVSKENGS